MSYTKIYHNPFNYKLNVITQDRLDANILDQHKEFTDEFKYQDSKVQSNSNVFRKAYHLNVFSFKNKSLSRQRVLNSYYT